MATHSSTLAWKIPWTEEPDGLQSMGLQRVRHNLVTSLSVFSFMHWRRKWQPIPVFLPEESQGQEPGGLPSMGSHRVGHDWHDIAAAAAWPFEPSEAGVLAFNVYWPNRCFAILSTLLFQRQGISKLCSFSHRLRIIESILGHGHGYPPSSLTQFMKSSTLPSGSKFHIAQQNTGRAPKILPNHFMMRF